MIDKPIEIERAHRVAKNEYQRKNNLPRTIVCKLLRFPDKENILSKRANLHGSTIYVNEDFSEETSRKRRELQFEAKRHRAEGRFARVVYNRLVVRDREDTPVNIQDTQR